MVAPRIIVLNASRLIFPPLGDGMVIGGGFLGFLIWTLYTASTASRSWADAARRTSKAFLVSMLYCTSGSSGGSRSRLVRFVSGPVASLEAKPDCGQYVRRSIVSYLAGSGRLTNLWRAFLIKTAPLPLYEAF